MQHGLESSNSLEEEIRTEPRASSNTTNERSDTRSFDASMRSRGVKPATFFAGLMIGMHFGYLRSLSYSVQEKQPNYRLQSLLMLAQLPLAMRVLVGPWMASLRSRCAETVDRCGVFVSSAVSGSVLMVSSCCVDRLIEQQSVAWLLLIELVLHCCLIFFADCFDSLLISRYAQHSRHSLSILNDFGVFSGEFLSFNVLLPLVSPQFLRHFAGEHFAKHAVLTHGWFLFFFGAASLGFGVFTLTCLGVSRDRRTLSASASDTREKSCFSVARDLLHSQAMRQIVAYFVLTRVARQMASGVLKLKYIDNGFSKADLANTDTLGLPLLILVNVFVLRTAIQSKPFYLYHLMVYLCCFASIASLAALSDFKAHKNHPRTFVLLSVTSLLEKIASRPVFFNAFLYRIAPREGGSTFIGFFWSITNITSTIPTSIGLWLESVVRMSSNQLILLCLLVQLMLHLNDHHYAQTVDEKPSSHFRAASERSRRLREQSAAHH